MTVQSQQILTAFTMIYAKPILYSQKVKKKKKKKKTRFSKTHNRILYKMFNKS